MMRQVAQLLVPYADGGAAALKSPLHASVQRWGSALYPVPDGAHGIYQGQVSQDPPALVYCTWYQSRLCNAANQVLCTP